MHSYIQSVHKKDIIVGLLSHTKIQSKKTALMVYFTHLNTQRPEKKT